MNVKPLTLIAAVSALSLFAAGCGNAPQAPTASSQPPGQESPTAQTQQPNGARRGGAGMMNVPAGSKAFFGFVATVNGTTVTLGGRTATTTVNLLPTTQYTSSTQADIKADVRILGYGTPKADGSIDAQTVRIAPAMGGGRGGFRNGGNPSGMPNGEPENGAPPAPPQGQ